MKQHKVFFNGKMVTVEEANKLIDEQFDENGNEYEEDLLAPYRMSPEKYHKYLFG